MTLISPESLSAIFLNHALDQEDQTGFSLQTDANEILISTSSIYQTENHQESINPLSSRTEQQFHSARVQHTGSMNTIQSSLSHPFTGMEAMSKKDEQFLPNPSISSEGIDPIQMSQFLSDENSYKAYDDTLPNNINFSASQCFIPTQIAQNMRSNDRPPSVNPQTPNSFFKEHPLGGDLSDKLQNTFDQGLGKELEHLDGLGDGTPNFLSPSASEMSTQSGDASSPNIGQQIWNGQETRKACNDILNDPIQSQIDVLLKSIEEAWQQLDTSTIISINVPHMLQNDKAKEIRARVPCLDLAKLEVIFDNIEEDEDQTWQEEDNSSKQLKICTAQGHASTRSDRPFHLKFQGFDRDFWQNLKDDNGHIILHLLQKSDDRLTNSYNWKGVVHQESAQQELENSEMSKSCIIDSLHFNQVEVCGKLRQTNQRARKGPEGKLVAATFHKHNGDCFDYIISNDFRFDTNAKPLKTKTNLSSKTTAGPSKPTNQIYKRPRPYNDEDENNSLKPTESKQISYDVLVNSFRQMSMEERQIFEDKINQIEFSHLAGTATDEQLTENYKSDKKMLVDYINDTRSIIYQNSVKAISRFLVEKHSESILIDKRLSRFSERTFPDAENRWNELLQDYGRDSSQKWVNSYITDPFDLGELRVYLQSLHTFVGSDDNLESYRVLSVFEVDPNYICLSFNEKQNVSVHYINRLRKETLAREDIMYVLARFAYLCRLEPDQLEDLILTPYAVHRSQISNDQVPPYFTTNELKRFWLYRHAIHILYIFYFIIKKKPRMVQYLWSQFHHDRTILLERLEWQPPQFPL